MADENFGKYPRSFFLLLLVIIGVNGRFRMDTHYPKVLYKECDKNGKHRANNKCQDDIWFLFDFYRVN
jgi:hypothetical protein